MKLTFFGTTVEAPDFSSPDKVKEIVARAVPKKEERRFLETFLTQNSPRGQSHLEEIKEQAAVETKKINITNDPLLRQKTAAYLVEQMKTVVTSAGLPVYEDLKLQVVEQLDKGKCGKYSHSRRTRPNSRSPLPFGLPDLLAKAESMVLGKITSETKPRDCLAYLAAGKTTQQIRTIARNLFFCVNSGLETEQTQRLLSLFYELDRLSVRQATNEKQLRQNLLRAIKGEPLEIIHIKCARFTYPYGNKLAMGDHLGPIDIPTKDGGNYHLIGQESFLSKLQNLCQIFRSYQINIKLAVLVNDRDLEDHFPVPDEIVNREDLEKAEKTIEKFTQLIAQSANGGEVKRLTDYLKEKGLRQDFDKIRTDVLSRLQAETSSYPKTYIDSVVDKRYQLNKQIFVLSLGRVYARERIYHVLATMQAMGVLDGRTLEEKRNLLFVESDMGNDSRFIGGHDATALPVFFINLPHH